ncbi:MAG: hypothetical protein Q8R76_05385 [Candidatus Omnitrophota bacterium]|nr:hypothetical protein [Candidatus Omnitrophota bacterium]
MKIPPRWYRLYDRIMTRLNLPLFYCSQCENKVRHWVYHFNGLVHCQSCADELVGEMIQLRMRGIG